MTKALPPVSVYPKPSIVWYDVASSTVIVGLPFVAVAKVSVGCFARSADLLPVVIHTATVSPAATRATLRDAAGRIGSGSVQVAPLSVATISAIPERTCMDASPWFGEAETL